MSYKFDATSMMLTVNDQTNNWVYYHIFSPVFDLSIVNDSTKRIAETLIDAVLNDRESIVNIELAKNILNKYRIKVGLKHQNNEYKYYILPDDLIYDSDNSIWNDEVFNDIINNSNAEINKLIGHDDIKSLFKISSINSSIKDYYTKDIIETYNNKRQKIHIINSYIEYFNQIISTMVSSNENIIAKKAVFDLGKNINKESVNEALDILDQYRNSNSGLYVLSKNVEAISETMDAFNSYFNNPSYNIQSILKEYEKQNYNDLFGTYKIICPRFKIFFREEDSNEILYLDEVYAYNDIVSVEIASERGAASRTAKIVLSNVLNRLADELSETYEFYGYSDTTNEQNINRMNIQPGMTIIIFGGYDEYVYDNPVFIGKIVEIYPGPQLSIVAQSFGAELLQVPYKDAPTDLKLSDDYGDYGDIASDVLNRIDAVHFGDLHLASFDRMYNNPEDYRQLDNIFKIATQGLEVDFDADRDLNVYLVKSYYLRKLYPSSKYKSWWVTPDQTAWDVLNELALYKQDYIVKTFPFNTSNLSEMRETVYVGPKNGSYVSGDLESFKLSILRENLSKYGNYLTYKNFSEFDAEKARMNNSWIPVITSELTKFFSKWNFFSTKRAADNALNTFSKDTQKEIINDILLKETILGASNDPEHRDVSIFVSDMPKVDKDNTYNKMMREKITYYAKTIANRQLSFFSPARNTHFISSHVNLISNNIMINGSFSNKVVLQFPKEHPHYDIKKVAKTAGIFTNIRNWALSGGSGLVTQEFTMDDNIRPENIREYITFQKNIDTQEAECGGNITRYNLKREIDSIIENKESYSEDYARRILEDIADNTKRGVGFKLWNNPFDVPIIGSTDQLINTLEGSNKNIANEWKNIYIYTPTSRISALDYYTILRKLNISHEKAITLMHIAKIRHPKWYTVGRNILAQQSSNMYDGTITIVGDFSIREGDRCVLFDLVNNIYGIFEVKAVTHHYSYDSGFTTTIVPALITYVNDKRDIFDSGYLLRRIMHRTGYSLASKVLAGIGGTAATGITVGVALAASVAAPIIGAIALVGGAATLAAIAKVEHEFAKYAFRESKTIYGRHAIGFIPIFKGGKPYVGGIGGYRKTSYGDVISSKQLFKNIFTG